MTTATVQTVNSDETLQLLEELERLQAENAALRVARPTGKLTLKIGDKGGLSVYGLGRWPVTLYREQWLRLLAIADDVRAFIQANTDKLATKPVA